MKTQFTHNNTRYEPGETFGRETSRGCGRDPARSIYRTWTRWTYSEYHRAWIHDGQFDAPHNATKKQILAAA
jgi:hypothetical protein